MHRSNLTTPTTSRQWPQTTRAIDGRLNQGPNQPGRFASRLAMFA